MKNISKILYTGAIALLTLSSCQRDLTSLNEDPKHTSFVPSENLIATGLYQSSYYMHTPSVNFNNYRFFTQQWAETSYPDETNYDLVTRNQPRNHFNRMYVYTLNNFEQAKKNLLQEGSIPENADPSIVANKLASLEISEIFVWENLVNTYGDVPYTDALKANDGLYAPKYDDAKTIYLSLLSRIDAVTATITTSKKGYSTGDLVYFGDMLKWKKFANSIKLRLAMNLADVDPTLSKSAAEAAIAAGVISSQADSYSFTFDSGTFPNPVYDDLVASGRSDFLPSDIIVDAMNDKNDPRRQTWFTLGEDENGTPVYVGGVFGAVNGYVGNSHLSDFFRAKNSPANLLSYTEILFLKAEAAARGYNAGGSAVSFYNSAVENSMTENNVIAADALTYLAAHPYNAAEWKKSIGYEAWIAMFNRGFAAWTFSRRLDYPEFEAPEDSNLASVPTRLPYSDQEYVLNGANVSAAATKITGGDKATSKLFWDIK